MRDEREETSGCLVHARDRRRMVENGGQKPDETQTSKPKKSQPAMQGILNRPITRKKVVSAKAAAKTG